MNLGVARKAYILPICIKLIGGEGMDLCQKNAITDFDKICRWSEADWWPTHGWPEQNSCSIWFLLGNSVAFWMALTTTKAQFLGGFWQ